MVSIITVNYNGLRDTCEMIDSFRNHETYPHYEIIVVDNGSRLPEAEEIQERYRSNLVPGGSLSGNPASGTPVSFPPVKVVRNINNGFAGGNNAGLKAAGGDYLFFINNDLMLPMVQTGIGWCAIGVMLTLEVIGYLVIRSIVDIKV